MRPTKFPGVFEERRGRMTVLLTRNLVPGKTVYNENLVREDGVEYREWDPMKSKLASSILKGISQTGLKEGHSVLYLGASTGTTVSHVSDIVGSKGFVFAVEFAPRVARQLVYVAESRKNIAPILADANQPGLYFHKVTLCDFLYQDIAQKNQAEIFLKNMMFLKRDGFGILCVKSRSIDISKTPAEIFRMVRAQLEREVVVVDYRLIDPFQRDHCVFVCKKK
jgi:fibrillarin-like pre-rRNA processing protein